MVNLANSISAAMRFKYDAKKGSITLQDFISCTYPKASPQEVKFLSETAPEIATDSSLVKKGVTMTPLTAYEAVKSMEIYDLLEKLVEGGLVRATHVIIRAEALLPEDKTHLAAKQVAAVMDFLPLTTEMSRERFRNFLSINKASESPICLDAFKTSLLGHDIVLGRYLRKYDSVEAEAPDELGAHAAKPRSLLTRIAQRFKRSSKGSGARAKF